MRRLSRYSGTDAWLLDSHVAGSHGGTGRGFDWNLAVTAKQEGHPLILAGGLNPENVLTAVEHVQPYGVDVSSGVELSPGRKDPAKMRLFIQNARAAGKTQD